VSISPSLSPSLSSSLSPSLSPSISSSISPSISPSPSPSPSPAPNQVIYKLYNASNVYIRTLTEITGEINIEKTLFGGSGPLTLIFAQKIDELSSDIDFNKKIKIYFKNKYSHTPRLVYYGYIVSIDPIIQENQEQSGVTCLGAISKLSNDYLRTGSDLAYEVSLNDIDNHIKTIVDHYRDSINTLHSSYAPSMIAATTYFPGGASPDTNYVEDTSTIGSIPYRYFNLKHLESIREIAKFLPKNDTANAFWYWWINDEGKFKIKKLSTTADHTLFLNKHLISLEMRKNIEGVVNKVFFWNEKGVEGERVRLIKEDSTSQTNYDIVADRITDTQLTTDTQATLYADARLKENKDAKAEASVIVSDAHYDILTFEPGQVVNIRDIKDTTLFPNRMIIQKIILREHEAVLELATPRPDLTTQVETDREYVDKQLRWFGDILCRIDGTRIHSGVQHWVSEDVSFAPATNTASTQVNWTAGTFTLPSDVRRVIASGNTGVMNTAYKYYLYVDEKNCWCTKDTGGAAVETGTGSVTDGYSFMVSSTNTSSNSDAYKGNVLWVNPSGGSAEKHIITRNTPSVVHIDSSDPFDTTDAVCPYEIHKFVLRQTHDRGTGSLNVTGTADSGSTTTLVDAVRTEVDDHWNGYEIKFRSGNNAGLIRTITDFVAITDTITFSPSVPNGVANGDAYEIYLSAENQIILTDLEPTTDTSSEVEIVTNLSTLSGSSSGAVGGMLAINGFDSSSNLIKDVINARMNTATKKILSDFDFGTTNYAGALKAGDIAWDTSTGAITSGSGVAVYRKGIIGATAGATTFSIDATTGSAYFSGELAAAYGTFGTITAGTFIGTVFKTASSGDRIELNSSGWSHKMIAYDVSEDEYIEIAAADRGIHWFENLASPAEIAWIIATDPPAADPYLQLGAWKADGINSTIVYISEGVCYPATATDLGKSTAKWQHLYLSGNIVVDGTVDGTDIVAHVGNVNAHHAQSHTHASHTSIGASDHHSSTSNALTITPTKVSINSPAGTTAALNVNGDFHLYTGSFDIKNTGASIAWGGVPMLADGGVGNLRTLKPFSLLQLASAPASVPDGTIYYDTALGQFRGKAGGSWYTL